MANRPWPFNGRRPYDDVFMNLVLRTTLSVNPTSSKQELQEERSEVISRAEDTGSSMDRNMLAGLEGLPEQDKARMTAMIDHLQLRDRFLHLCPRRFSYFEFPAF